MDVVLLAGTDPSITKLVCCFWEEFLKVFKVHAGLRR